MIPETKMNSVSGMVFGYIFLSEKYRRVAVSCKIWGLKKMVVVVR